jgi:hypothetical protein
MAYSLVTASVIGSPLTATYTVNTKHPSGETASTAINIGDLEQDSESVDDNQTIFLSQSFGNFVDQASTQIQLEDSNGNIIADNQGTTAQQQAFVDWSSSGLTPGAGTYTVIATPTAGIGAAPVNVTSVAQQGTSLGVTSQLTGADTSEFYNFSLGNGNNIKLAYDAGSSTAQTRVQVYNSTGQLVADSNGNSFQQANYVQLTSATGLAATSGNYSVKVSYAPGADTTQNINYNFQLYSGVNYSVVYNNNVTTPAADYSAAATVTATATAQLYSRQSFNTINASPANNVNIGWLSENKSRLDVASQLTAADSTDYYSFTFVTGDNLKLGFANTNTTNASPLRVQLLNQFGTQVIADNQGTAAQKAAYKSLTTTNGLAANPGQYLVKVGYAPGASHSATQNYNFQLYSGTSYSASYKTTASAQTYGNALLLGDAGTYTAAGGFASYLSGVANGTTADLFQTISALV